jgi:heme/copper-type cytochrome/quinol oxidase subunit 4
VYHVRIDPRTEYAAHALIQQLQQLVTFLPGGVARDRKKVHVYHVRIDPGTEQAAHALIQQLQQLVTFLYSGTKTDGAHTIYTIFFNQVS